MFGWAVADLYEQLSDAYTFMELRKVAPEQGDHLYSTLRRPMLTIESAFPARSVDFLLHDRWHGREDCASVFSILARRQDMPAPEMPNWPFAVNLFARTVVTSSGDLIDQEAPASQGSRISLVARFDLVLAIAPAGPSGALKFELLNG